MNEILFVGQKEDSYSNLYNILKTFPNITLMHTQTGKSALVLTKWNKIDLVIVCDHLNDMTGLEFVRQLVLVNPIINVYFVSSKPKEKFHKESEGLGILGQIPIQSTKRDIEQVLLHLSGILNHQPNTC